MSEATTEVTVQKKPRNMSIQGFITKSLSKSASSATSFLQTHREWLQTGAIAAITTPILNQMDSGDLMPTPALTAIRTAVYQHMLALDIQENEDKMVRRAVDAALKAQKDADKDWKPKVPKEPKAYVATIYTADGEIASRINAQGEEELLQKEFNTPQDSDRWVDRRLVTGESDWYGEVSHTKMTIKGEPMTMRIDRKDSIGRTFRPKTSAAMRVQKGSGKLSFGVRVRNHVSKFSHG